VSFTCCSVAQWPTLWGRSDQCGVRVSVSFFLLYLPVLIFAPRVYRVAKTIGCLKLQVIFRKTASNHRDVLRKMTYKDKASSGSSLPCMPRRSHLYECAEMTETYIPTNTQTNMDVFTSARLRTHTHTHARRSFLAKEPLIIGFFCGKWLTKIRHRMGLRHPVQIHWQMHQHVLESTAYFIWGVVERWGAGVEYHFQEI